MNNQSSDRSALATIRKLLRGEAPNGASPDSFGPDWAETITLLFQAHAQGGTTAVRQAFHQMSRQNPLLPQRVLGSDKEPLEPISEAMAAALNAFPTTDAGQGEAVALLYGDQLRYDHARRRYLVWDHVSRWSPNMEGEPAQFAKITARRRLEAAARHEDDKKRVEIAKWALACENYHRIKAALEMAKTEVPVSTTADQFDHDPWLMACANGVLDLRTGQARPGFPEDMLTLSTNLPYRAEAACPRWLQFLAEVFKEDQELIAFIQRAVGYSLTGSTREQCLFILWGSGANGKSVFLTILRTILGEFATNTPFDTFLEADRTTSGSSPSPDLVALCGARLVTAAEVAEGKRMNEARVKAITGNDPITARDLHAPLFTFTPQFKLWLAVNHKPQISETEEAIWRRIRLIPFTAHFPPGKADPNLVDTLIREAPGILAWAVQGCLQWQQEGLCQPQAVRQATDMYRAEQDVVGRFLDECTVRVPSAWVEASDLYAAYKEWCSTNGEKEKSGTWFGRRITDMGFTRGKEPRTRRTIYEGLGLISQRDGEEPASSATATKPKELHQARMEME